MTAVPTRIIDDGRVTIPVEIRRKLDLEKGDWVLVDVKPLNTGDPDER